MKFIQIAFISCAFVVLATNGGSAADGAVLLYQLCSDKSGVPTQAA
jgi:hypothetical protein